VVRGFALSGLRKVLLTLRKEMHAAAATRIFAFLNVGVPDELDLPRCAAHLDQLGISHTEVLTAAPHRLAVHDRRQIQVCG